MKGRGDHGSLQMRSSLVASADLHAQPRRSTVDKPGAMYDVMPCHGRRRCSSPPPLPHKLKFQPWKRPVVPPSPCLPSRPTVPTLPSLPPTPACPAGSAGCTHPRLRSSGTACRAGFASRWVKKLASHQLSAATAAACLPRTKPAVRLPWRLCSPAHAHTVRRRRAPHHTAP